MRCCQHFGGRACVPEVRSQSGNDAPVNLHRVTIILCSDKKRHGPQGQPSPSEVQPLPAYPSKHCLVKRLSSEASSQVFDAS